jgi:hypothetical protein
MKTLLLISSISLLQLSVIYGNGGQPPPPPRFLSTEISGLPHQAPLFFADTNTATILIQAAFFTPSSIEGNIGIEGTSKGSLQYRPNQDLNWKLSGGSFYLGVSINASKIWAFFTVVNIEENGSADIDLGTSILVNAEGDIRARFDLGLSSLSMDMETTFLSTAGSDTSQRVEKQNDKGWDPFFSLTLNTMYDNWIINPFVQIAYCHQTFFNIDWTKESEIYSNSSVFSFTPGITYSISEEILLVVGSSYYSLSQIENKSSPGIFSGFVQTNFMF